jgi:signal transduction histidine kinase
MAAETTHILLIEDDRTGREALAELLEVEGYAVTAVEDGQRGLELMSGDATIDVVISDIKMPRAGGVDVLRTARALRPDVSVILVTGYGSLETATAAVRQGAFAYLMKPLDIDQLLSLVEEAARKVWLLRENKRLVENLWKANLDLEARVGELEQANQRIKIAERALSDHEKMRALGQLVAGIAHELRNPLSGILGLADAILDSGNVVPEDREDIQHIKKLGFRCGDIVENLLRFARKESLEKAPIRIDEALAQALMILKSSIRTAGVEVLNEVPADLPSLLANQNQLVQVLFNIVQNAVQAMDATPAGQRRIHVGVERDGASLSIMITDSGPGIAEIDRVFEPFYTTKPVGQGTGLGLALSRGIIEEHGGTITAENWPLGGARFRIRLPAAHTPPRLVEPAKQEAPPVLPSRPLRLVMVEDDEFFSRAIVRGLSRRGFEVESFSAAAPARQRLESAAESEVDLVLTDLRMPGDLDGRGLIRWIAEKRSDLLPGLTVMTGDLMDTELRAFRDDHQITILSKPFAIDELIAVLLSKATRTSRSAQVPTEAPA